MRVHHDPTLPPEGWSWDPLKYALKASCPSALLYAVFGLLRSATLGVDLRNSPLADAPKVALRMINHWDNIHPRNDIERGYGGRSLFHWEELPALRPLYEDYARLLASVGINAIVLNNVNAGEPGIGGYRLITPEFLPKLAALADLFRRWGIRCGISISFSSPTLTGDLSTDDPRDPAVRAWWAARTAEIYRQIPDFLGYLIKADSEGQPGPAKYGLTHAEGARAISDALLPYGGRLFWRAFVYGLDNNLDIVAQPYAQFKPLDGSFPSNCSVQIKYGPRDFQPREPIHPLLGALEKTATALELQITQEYLGHDTHAVFLPTLWEEILRSPVWLAPTLADFLSSRGDSAIVGVSNVSDAPNWTGHLFAQANLYGFGRLAWNPYLDADTILREWTALTFPGSQKVINTTHNILSRSHATFIGYTAPYCLGQVHGNGPNWDLCHYDPDPAAKNGTDLFYADAQRIGIDRTLSSGRGVLEQYPPPLRELFNDPNTCPEKYLLWFHQLPWHYRLKDGRTLAEAIDFSYWANARRVEDFIREWQALEPHLAPSVFSHVLEKLHAQHSHALHWARHMTDYFTNLRENKKEHDPPEALLGK